MVVGKLLILLIASPVLANDLENPRFFEYRNGGVMNQLFDQMFGWFKTLDSEQKLSYNQAVMHAASYADNGEAVRWYKNNAGGSVTPNVTWPVSDGYCRRLYIYTVAHGVEKTTKVTACFNDTRSQWAWYTDK